VLAAASIFSEPFQVFLAKKFPGMVESTPLSKWFALQGINIPVRKDGADAGETEMMSRTNMATVRKAIKLYCALVLKTKRGWQLASLIWLISYQIKLSSLLY
jgi:SH3-like domain-containing protein